MRIVALVILVLLCPSCGRPRLTKLPPIDLKASAAMTHWSRAQDGAGRPTYTDPRTGISFVEVPPGTFDMGGMSPIDTPRHRVEITRPFLLATTEVTVAQWIMFLRRDSGSFEAPLPKGGSDDAVCGVSWLDAQAFCAAYGYQLPTEAQWEYACRAGADDATAPWKDRAQLARQAWIYTNSYEQSMPHAVGRLEANAFGLNDMLGNVWEWCQDPYLAPYPVADAKQVTQDPLGTVDSGLRVLRGGSWYSVPVPFPSDRVFGAPDNRSFLFGFRVAHRAAENR